MAAPVFPARWAAASQLARFSDKARSNRLGAAGSRRLFDDINHARMHAGHAVSLDRMHGRDVEPGDATTWPVAGVDVLLVVWFVWLRDGSVVDVLICMEPEDFLALEQTVMDQPMLERAHENAAEFLEKAGLWPSEG